MAMHGNEDLTFNFSTAETVAGKFRSAAQSVRDQHSQRNSLVTTGSEDFKGGFADGFKFNAETASSDATELATQLDNVAAAADDLARQAKEENDRRRVAREYFERKESWVGKVEEFFHLEGPAPTGPSSAPVSQPAPVTPKGMARQSPLELATASNGVSSGNPTNLRSYASGSSSLNDDLSSLPGTLRTQLTDFASQCKFGTLNADGVITAFNDWLSANKNDVTWARSVADAFEAAGGEGTVSTVSNASLFAALKNAGVGATRSDLKVPAAEVKGGETTTGYASDPINTATGNFIEPELDLTFAGAAQALRVERMYNSISETNGSFGPGWDSIFDIRLNLTAEGATCVMSDGRELFFARQGDGWDRANAANYWLNKYIINGTELLVVADNEGAQWGFNHAGAWLFATQGEGTRIEVQRDERARVSRLVHEYGRWVSIERLTTDTAENQGNSGDPEQRITSLTTSDGRTASYEYNSAGQLTSVTATGAGTRRYEWNAAGLIYKVIDAHGVVEAENTYDEKNRVITQISEFGRITRFSYLPGLVTSVSDVDGSRSNTYVSDPLGRLISVTDGHDQEQRMSYDAHGNLLNAIERDGGVTRHQYDSRGRRIRTKTRDSGELTYGYDANDRITTMVAGNGGTTTFEYSDPTAEVAGAVVGATRNPSVIIDPMGGHSQMTWNDGLLTKVVDPTGVTITLDYDDHGDLTAITNAYGNVATFERNGAGQLIRAISPSGAATVFEYNTVGNLIRLTDAEGGTWRYEYGENARISASIDPSGGRTTYEYDPVHGHLISTIDPLGRATEQAYDDLGRVEAVTLANGARWSFEHDLLSQLRSVTDPLGGVWRNEYSVNGDLTATVDPTGVRESASIDQKTKTLTVADAFSKETIKFDEFGRPVQSVAPDGSAEVMVYDLAGRVVEFLDGEGHLTKFTYDLAGRMVQEISPSGAVSRYEYDAAGRPSVMTDPSGAQVRLEYNEDSLVIARHYASSAEASEDQWQSEYTFYDKVGRVIAQGAARFEYDACGRLTGLQDPIHGTRHFQYDAAGQLTAVANGVGGVTRYEYDVTGNLITTIDPLGNVSSREYDDAGRLIAEIDPLGRKTCAGYDAAGRLIWQRTGDEQELRWTYDRAGQLKTVGTPTRVLAEYARDAARRCVSITDHTRSAGVPVEHVLRFDGVGNLLSHTRDGQGPSWAYDSEGRVVSVTDPTGITVSYGHDLVGRVTVVEHPVFGQIVYTYDHEGQLVSTAAQPKDALDQAVTQSWEYAFGAVSRHEVSGGGQAPVVTTIARDDLGRIASVQSSNGVNAQYAFDGAHQLVGVYEVTGSDSAYSSEENSTGAASATSTPATNTPATVLSSEWVYDTAGRLIRETDGGRTTEYVYDAASQLLSRTTTSPGGTVETVAYAYDGAGRRISERSDSSERVFSWAATGRLNSITTTVLDPATGAPAGEPVTQELWVDALGDLAQIDGADLWWDTTATTPELLAVGGVSVTHAPAGNTIVDGHVSVAGWRSAHPSHPATPWSQNAVPGLPSTPGTGMGTGTGITGIPGLPEHVQLTGNGQLNVQGLDWLGARLYDPSTRGFLSTDPLEPTTGAGWASNPYSYAGNDPVHQIDPLGLSPVSTEELKAYSEARQGQSLWNQVRSGAASVGHAISDSFVGDAVRATGNWIEKHPYIAGTALMVGGAALMFTGVGGPVGLVMMGAVTGGMTSAGASLVAQQATTGKVDMKKVGNDALIGAAGGAASGGIAAIAAKGASASIGAIRSGSSQFVHKAGQKLLSRPVARGVISAGGGGAASNATALYRDGEPNTWSDYVLQTGLGFGLGAVSAGGVGLASSKVSGIISRKLPKLSVPFTRGRHSTHGRRADPLVRFNWAGFSGEQLTDRFAGAGIGYGYTRLTSEPADKGQDDSVETEGINSALQGFARGSSGTISGRH
ncbi:DUF6531 domain-containing protein [Glutamicibacter sp. JC586]|uniref:DUF6531 domain-containing protein n=1 Tax=Glutamicibacter sp. JC586 TaxID=2590552 RepID=UPI00135764D5|nr:DUF6531 domain-containing protein [Glutamicibacter sp. JC586]